MVNTESWSHDHCNARGPVIIRVKVWFLYGRISALTGQRHLHLPLKLLFGKKSVRDTVTVKLTKPWTPEIFMECYYLARNKPIRCEITKPQTATVISLWFWALLTYPQLYCDWLVHNQHSRNFSGVHGFLSLTVSYESRKQRSLMNFNCSSFFMLLLS